MIELIKRNRDFSVYQIENILKQGIDPNFLDTDKRSSLHHLVFNSNNLDSSKELAHLLLKYGCKINGLDKFDRSPIFYCFCDIEEHESTDPLEKVEILQILINHKDINLNLVDVFKRTILHYAC